MSFGGEGAAPNQAPPALLMRVNQSAYGLAIARVWGTRRVPGNLLWYGDFIATAHADPSSSGGKGGGGGASTSKSYTYTAAMAIGLCTGPIAGVGTVWMDKTQTTLAALGLTLKTGELGQAVWSHLTANHSAEAIGYSGIAYLANAAFDLGDSPSSPQLNFEVQGERIIAGGNGDAAPADIVNDIVTDPVEGLGLGSILADMTDYRTWCSAMNLTLSVAATAQQPARDQLAQIFKATLADTVWSQGKLRIVPYGDHAVGAWTPDTTPLYDIGEGDLLAPPAHSRKQPADAINRETVTYSDRANDYNTVPVTRDDLSAVTQFGARPESLDLPCITGGDMAALVAEFWRDRNLYIRNSFDLLLDERFCRLEPMDLLTLTYWPQALDHLPVRVVEVGEAEDGELTITVEEWPFGLARPTALPTQGPSGYVPAQQIAPGAVNTPVIFEAPNALTAPNLEIWIAASGGINWGGAFVWISDDNATYQQAGVIANPARHGTLTSALAAGADPDTVHTLFVDTSASRAQLNSGSQDDADNLNTLLWVDGELIAYETATLTSASHYSLTYLRRGAKGTASAGHSSGAQFTRLDDAVFRYTVPRERIGRAVWIKLQSFNQFGLSLQPLATVTAYNYTIQGNKPLPPATLTATGGMFQNVLHWTFAAGQIGIDYTEIWGGTTNNRASAFPLTSQKGTVNDWKHPGLLPGQDWYYWARVIDTSTNESDFYPASATAGVHARPSTDPSALLTQLIDSLGMAQLATELAEPIALVPVLDATLEWEQTNTAIQAAGLLALSAGERVHATAQVTTEQTARVDGDGATADLITLVSARLDTGDYAAVKEESSATATSMGTVLAKHTIKVDADGHVGAIELMSDGTTSDLIFLSDKLLWAMPDGSGPPHQILVGGLINGTATIGLDGNLIIDGSIIARHIAVTSLSAISADIGTVTAGRVQNPDNTNFLNLDATGANSFLKVGSGVDIFANGDATFNGVVISRNLNVATGSATALVDTYAITAGDGWKLLKTVTVDTGYGVASWEGVNDATYQAAAGADTGLVYVFAPGADYGTWVARWGVKVKSLMPKTTWNVSEASVLLELELWAEVDGAIYQIEFPAPTWKLFKVT